MSKLITLKEAEEIINTMLLERGLSLITVVWHDSVGDGDSSEYRTPGILISNHKFLWWKWKTKRQGKSWLSAYSLLSLIKKAESHLDSWDTRMKEELRETDIIRQRHSTRLLNNKLEE